MLTAAIHTVFDISDQVIKEIDEAAVTIERRALTLPKSNLLTLSMCLLINLTMN